MAAFANIGEYQLTNRRGAKGQLFLRMLEDVSGLVALYEGAPGMNPSNNKSWLRLINLQCSLQIRSSAISRSLPGLGATEAELSRWAFDEVCFRRGLTELEIAQLRLIRPMATFSPDDRETLKTTIDRITETWKTLLVLFPLEAIQACFVRKADAALPPATDPEPEPLEEPAPAVRAPSRQNGLLAELQGALHARSRRNPAPAAPPVTAPAEAAAPEIADADPSTGPPLAPGVSDDLTDEDLFDMLGI